MACRAVVAEAAHCGPSDDGARLARLAHLARLLADYLDVLHDTDLRGVVTVLERILAVLTLDLPGTRALVTRLLLQHEVSPDNRAVFDDVLVAWREAGVRC